MPDISAITNLNDLAGVAAQPGPFEMQQADLANKDTFLKLLTTQLSNQDPTSPMENEQFLSQLAQFSSLEQMMGMQATMQAVYSGIQAMNNSSMANLLGTEVVARGDTVHLDGEGGGAELGWSHPTNLSSATITITDATGKVVDTIDVGSIDADGTYAWDGTGRDGQPLPEGDYTFKVRGTDADGNLVTAETRIRGTVTGMDYTTGTPQPSVNGVPLSLNDILTLQAGA